MSAAEVEKLAFDLPERERAMLATNLLRSLPAMLRDEDEEVGRGAMHNWRAARLRRSF